MEGGAGLRFSLVAGLAQYMVVLERFFKGT